MLLSLLLLSVPYNASGKQYMHSKDDLDARIHVVKLAFSLYQAARHKGKWQSSTIKYIFNTKYRTIGEFTRTISKKKIGTAGGGVGCHVARYEVAPSIDDVASRWLGRGVVGYLMKIVLIVSNFYVNWILEIRNYTYSLPNTS